MTERSFTFGDFSRKWVPEPPAWGPAPEGPASAEEAGDEERRRTYMERLRRTGGERFSFSPELEERLKRDVLAGVPILTLLEGLLGDPEIPDRDAIMVLFQRVFGVPVSRARFIASWQPGNRSSEARKVLERVSLCIADAHRAGLWRASGEEPGGDRERTEEEIR